MSPTAPVPTPIKSEEFPMPREIILRESELINLRAEGHLCDLVVQVQDCDGVWYDFAAHKVVLAATSSFFFSLYEC